MSNVTLARRIWGLRKPRRLASVVLRRLHLSHFFTIETSGIRLRFFPAVWTNLLWEQPEYFRRDTELLKRWLRPGDVLLDCGANVGLLTLVGSCQVGPGGKVWAIEAHPRTFRFLEENVALNEARNVTLIHAAVGEKEGSVLFSDQPTDDGNHIVSSGSDIAVPMKPLTSLLPAGTAVRLLKLDVEGYELKVLEGAGALLDDTQALYFESSDVLFARYGYACSDVFALLRAKGFGIYLIEDNETLHQLPLDYVSRRIENLIALRDVAEFSAATGYKVSNRIGEAAFA